MTTLNSLTKVTSQKKRVGRGIGSGKGKTSGRGHKGQKSRSGVAIKSFEGGQMPLYRRLPKRGFNPINKKKTAKINLDKIQKFIDRKIIKKDEIINVEVLKKNKIIKKNFQLLKILGNGEINEKISIETDSISSSAKNKVEKLGGIIKLKKKQNMSAAPQSNDLRNRVIFTILILSIYRLGTFVPIPGIDPDQLQILIYQQQTVHMGNDYI